MMLIQLLPAFVLLGLAQAGPLLERRESRAECLARHALESSRLAPASDVTICYTAHPDVRDRSPNKYGYIDTFKCPGTAVYCFWMKGENLFEAGGDGGSDNIAMQISDKCQYLKNDVVVYCAP